MDEKKWYRVIDPLNPLYGCDVSGVEALSVEGWLNLTAMRRVDVFVGDRPFQLIAKSGEYLGVLIDCDHLALAPIQDVTMVTGTDRPHGLCLDESEMVRKDGVTLRVARYERATQIAVEDAEENLLGTSTETGDFKDEWERQIIALFESGAEPEDIAYALEEN